METEYPLDDATKTQMVAYWYDNIISCLEKQKLAPYPSDLPSDDFPICKIFWTWLINGNLNGWIGTFQGAALSKVIPEYVVTYKLH